MASTTRLRPWPQADEPKEEIITTLARINHERGHFRHLTTECLNTEIANSKNGDTDGQPNGIAKSSEPEDGADDTKESSKTRIEKLYQTKAELQAHIASAQNEALMALDFVSLLISKHMPRQADQTMSPFLKQQVKPGTLGLDMWQNMVADKARDATDSMIAKGWRMKMLQQSADSLVDAANRLKADVTKETKYWSQVLDICDSGWPVSRMPRERGTLGVRYGFLEAAGEYKARGMAALRPAADGSIRLDTKEDDELKTIRVRIVDNGRTISESCKNSKRAISSSGTMQAALRDARDSIYEQELFHEIMLETRLLLPLGVQLDDSTIKIQLSPPIHDQPVTRFIHLDLVTAAASKQNLQQDTKTNTISSQPAQGIALLLRLLLSQFHRNRLAGRSKLPQPLSSRSKERRFASILRPLVAVTHHISAVQTCTSYAHRIRKLLSKAGLEVSVQVENPVGIDARSIAGDMGSERLMHFVDTLGASLSSSIEIIVAGKPIVIELRSGPRRDESQQDQAQDQNQGQGQRQDQTHKQSPKQAAEIAGSHTIFTVTNQAGSKIETSDIPILQRSVDSFIVGDLAIAIGEKLGRDWSVDAHRGVVRLMADGDMQSHTRRAVNILIARVERLAEDEGYGACQLVLQSDAETVKWSTSKDADMAGEQNDEKQFWDAVAEATTK